MPDFVLSLTIKTAETIIEDDNVLLRIYRSCKRLREYVSVQWERRWGERDASLCVGSGHRSMQYPCFQSGSDRLGAIGVDLHLMRSYGRQMSTTADHTHSIQ
jgi:hypothetical protein